MAIAKQIRVVVIDDSLVFREFLSRALAKDPAIFVADSFGNPAEAANRIGLLRPDVITVDMEMPKMRGNEFLRLVLPRYPKLKAVVISSLSSNVFDAMQAGAIDFVSKPGSRPGYSNEQFIVEIIQKIKIAAAANVKAVEATVARPVAPPAKPTVRKPFGLSRVQSRSVVAIGASTGGTEAILAVVQKFPVDMPGVVVVQHMPPVFTRMYAERLDRNCPMRVQEAKNGDRVARGTVLIAPGGDQQMRIRSDAQGYFVQLQAGPKVSGHCPSVDVLFESVAKAAGNQAVGVLLTGMGADGAQHLFTMRQAGAHTIGQDEASCVVYGMPRVAYESGGVTEQLPLSAIGEAVVRRFL